MRLLLTVLFITASVAGITACGVKGSLEPEHSYPERSNY